MNSLPSLTWTDLADILLVSLLIWAAMVWLRRTRARAALAGLAILGAVYLAARQLDLRLTAFILQGFFAVLVLILVVVFQDELRRIFEQIGVLGLHRRRPTPPPDSIDVLVRTVSRLAQTRTGAILVLPGREVVERHLQGGVALQGSLSEPLLLSLFDPHSPGHDGAVVIQGDVVTRFAVHLPLSANQAELGAGGTRHAAALGLAERTDALCLVVSEERGTVSVAEEGHLAVVSDPGDLGPRLHRFAERVAPQRVAARRRWLTRRWPEALLAVVLASGAWLLTASGLDVAASVRSAPVVVENLPAGYVLDDVEPQTVRVTLTGPRRSLYFGDVSDLRIRVDARLVASGRRTFEVTPRQVEPPAGLAVLAVEPSEVRLRAHRRSPPEPGRP